MPGGVLELKVKPPPNNSAVALLPTLTLVVAFNVAVFTSVRLFKVLASLTFRPSLPSFTTPMLLLSVSLSAWVSPPLIFRVSFSPFCTPPPESPVKVILRLASATAAFSCATLTASVSALPAPTLMILRLISLLPMENKPWLVAL